MQGVEYYGLLELDRSATVADIRKAYRKLALKVFIYFTTRCLLDVTKQYHPEKNKEAEARKLFLEVTEAFDVLSDGKNENNVGNKFILFHFSQEKSNL